MQDASRGSTPHTRAPLSPRTVPVIILLRTHSNRWIARARRTGVALGLITFAADLPRPVFKTVRLDLVTGERVLLRDSDCLEEAFAVLIAGVERARIAAEAERTPTTTPTATDPVEESIAA